MLIFVYLCVFTFLSGISSQPGNYGILPPSHPGWLGIPTFSIPMIDPNEAGSSDYLRSLPSDQQIPHYPPWQENNNLAMPTQSETGSSKHPLPQRVDEESKELTSPSTLPLSGSGKRALTTSHPGIRKRRTDRRSGQHGNSGIIRAHSAVLCFLISVHDFSLLDDFIEKLFVDANFICDKSHTTILSSFSELPMTPKRLVFLKKLLDHGGDVCRKDEDGTPIAIKMIKLELEQFIRGHVGACYALTDRDGRTPFWWLIRYYSTRAIPSNLLFSTSLLSTTNAADKFGVTPFLLAITSCNPSLLRLLANYGDPFATTSDGITLLRLATESCLDGNQLIEITNIIIDLRLDGFLGPLSF